MAITRFQDAANAFDEIGADVLGINQSDMRCLGILILRGPKTATELANAAGLTKGAITALLDRLEQRGLLERRAAEGDRRRLEIAATPFMEALAAQIYNPLAREGYEIMMRYSDHELAAVERFLSEATDLQERHFDRVRSLSLEELEATARGQ